MSERESTIIDELTRNASPGDIREELAPRAGEATVRSVVDKFYGTELEEVLRSRGVQESI